MLTGGRLAPDDSLFWALKDHGSEGGRRSWDPMLVHMALVGDESMAGYDTVVGTATVDPLDGANTFVGRATGRHRYVVKRYPNAYYEEKINRLL